MLRPHDQQQPLRTIRNPMSDRMGHLWKVEELPDMHYQDAHKICVETDEARANGETPKELPEVIEHARSILLEAAKSV